MPMPFRLRHVHIHALLHDGRVALFDTGFNTPESFLVLDEALASLGRARRDIDHIFITHFHADHCGIAGGIQRDSGAVVHMSGIDEQRIEENRKEDVVVPAVRHFYRRHGLPGGAVETLIRLIGTFKHATLPFRVGGRLEPHETHALGGRTFEVIPAPGHTRGQVCFFFPEDRLLLSGDHVLPDITPNLSPDLFNPDFRPLKSFMESLEQIRDLSAAMVYPAHGDPFPDLRLRIDQIREHHEERKRLVHDAVKPGGKTAYEVSQDIFGSDLPDFDRFLALNESYVHLVELLQEGLADAREEGGFVTYRAT